MQTEDRNLILRVLPELHRGSCNLSLSVPFWEMEYVRFHVVETEKVNEYKDTFSILFKHAVSPSQKVEGKFYSFTSVYSSTTLSFLMPEIRVT